MRTVLLATIGMTPAVLTETVWALAHPPRAAGAPRPPPVIPDEISVITTVSGKRALEEQLFGADAVWDALRAEVLGPCAASDPRLCFDPSDIIVARKKCGGRKIPLDALSDRVDHTSFADAILDELWKHTSKDDTRVIASLAGGYKTMSALMLSALQLLANPGDRCTHVLASGGLDAPGSGFFFPRNKAEAAHVHLIDIPLIPLRRWFANLNRKPSSYDALVNDSLEALARRAEDLRIELPPLAPAARRWVAVNGAEYRLTPHQYAYLRFFAERAQAETPPFEALKQIADPFNTWIAAHGNLIQPGSVDADTINKRLSALRRALPILAPVLPARGNWALALPPSNIILR